ncbi:hypothetical protein ANCCAN_23448 [Ancylostoma caninum]|uniref:Uncharacterized protein n=1 Tax=Ancylostoma caninum TaxID=29170 RepID=A0A368FF40_ANCCA|nr:hypothetical protein ANCCAN_23448 [Ancylostoma caninum]
MYAVREWVYDRVDKEPKTPSSKTSPTPVSPTRIEEEKPKVYEPRRPSMEEMDAVRETGALRDDTTDRDGSSLEIVDVQSIMELPQQKSTVFTALTSDSRVETKGPMIAEGSIKLEDDGRSPKVLAYISVG